MLIDWKCFSCFRLSNSKFNCVLRGFKWKKMVKRERNGEKKFQMVRHVINRNSCGLIVIYWVSGWRKGEKKDWFFIINAVRSIGRWWEEEAGLSRLAQIKKGIQWNLGLSIIMRRRIRSEMSGRLVMKWEDSYKKLGSLHQSLYLSQNNSQVQNFIVKTFLSTLNP